MRIFDVHAHFYRDWQNPDADVQAGVDYQMDELRSAGISKACILSGGRGGVSHEDAIKALERHGDIAIPVAMIDPEEVDGRRVRQLAAMGYRGLKITGVRRAYDTDWYFRAYEAAEELGLPILFHLGVIGGGLDYSRTHPSHDPKAAEMYRRFAGGPWRRDTGAANMHPFHLDRIANNFPKLKIIGAHMGGTGNYEAAASVARWRHHVWLDMSGGETIEDHAEQRGYIGREIVVEKLVFGSDCPPAEVRQHVDRFIAMFDRLGLSEHEKERLWWRNGAEIYGLDPVQMADEIG
jgi:hypothetical protein